MPNRAVPGWTQVPVAAKDIQSIHYDRWNAAGTQNQLTVTYEVLDSTGAVRAVHTLSQAVASYPISIANILSSINTERGT